MLYSFPNLTRPDGTACHILMTWLKWHSCSYSHCCWEGRGGTQTFSLSWIVSDATLQVSAFGVHPCQPHPLRLSEQNYLHSIKDEDCSKMTMKSISILQLSFSSVFLWSSKLHCRIAVQDTQFKILIVSQVRDEVRIGSGFTYGTSCCPSNS